MGDVWQVVWSDWQLEDVDDSPDQDDIADLKHEALGGRPGSCIPGPRAAGRCHGDHFGNWVSSPTNDVGFKSIESTPTSKRSRGDEPENLTGNRMNNLYEEPRGRHCSQLSPFPARKRQGSPRLEFGK